jgi:hypothetical protein
MMASTPMRPARKSRVIEAGSPAAIDRDVLLIFYDFPTEH